MPFSFSSRCASFLVASLALVGTAGIGIAQTVVDANLTVVPVATGLELPTTMAFLAPDDFLVLEKNTGQVHRVVGGVLQPTPVLDVAVNIDSERGLLGIAVNADSPPKVFLYYTEVADPDGDGLPDSGTPLGNRVYRYTWNPATQRLESRTLIIDLPVTPGPNHDGGILVIGPATDGSPLYTVIGDLNRNGQLENFSSGPAPDDTGVIIKVGQAGVPHPTNPLLPYCTGPAPLEVCADNVDCPAQQTCNTAVERYIAYGVRNCFGLTLDPVTGDLWDTENGPGSFDEVNRVPEGMNSGWERIMGPVSRDPEGTSDLHVIPGSAYSDPEFSWLQTVAPTAILFPIGSSLGTAYDEVALVGDNNTGQIYRFPLNATRTAFDLSAFGGLQDLVADSATERDLVRFGSGFGAVTDLKISPDGDVYVVSIGNGAVYRIEPRSLTPTPDAHTDGDAHADANTDPHADADLDARAPTSTRTATPTVARTATTNGYPTLPCPPRPAPRRPPSLQPPR